MPRTILIVEDTEPSRDVLEMALMQLPGIVIRSVGTAEEALLYLASDDISALVTDLHLPQMDGFQLIEAVRARPRGSDMPIMVISGDNDPRTLERLVVLGASAYFPKPYSPSQVRQRLEELIDVP
ncbi:MAG: response regulator [Bryobacteraceae bacterium]|jgi:CheY-like chemotaxis protein